VNDGDVWEVVRLQILDDKLSEFESVVGTSLDVLRRSPGCHEALYMAGLEHPTRPLLFVRWGSVAEHMAFRESERFSDYRAPIQSCFATTPEFAHFRLSTQ
jgi:quinol monooxygenase YgiN